METVTFYDRYDVGVIRLPVAYYECLWDAANKNSIVILLCRNGLLANIAELSFQCTFLPEEYFHK